MRGPNRRIGIAISDQGSYIKWLREKAYEWGPLYGHSIHIGNQVFPSGSDIISGQMMRPCPCILTDGPAETYIHSYSLYRWEDRPQEVKWISQHYTANINRWGAEGGGGELGFENSGLLCSQVHFLCLIPWSPQQCGRASNGRLISSPFSKCRSVLFVLGVERRSEWQCYREVHLCQYIHTSYPHFP